MAGYVITEDDLHELYVAYKEWSKTSLTFDEFIEGYNFKEVTENED